MRIGIDARLINETGVGRYIRNLIRELAEIDKVNSFVVFVLDDSWKPPNERWEKRIVDVNWHSIAEQFIMPWIFLKARLDLVHIPYFNVPIFYPGKFVVTIHDLTILHFDTGKATTLPLPLYKLRRLGYFLALVVGLRRAQTIITVSKTTKQEIVDHFQIDPKRIVVTYEGVGNKFQIPISKFQIEKQIIKNPYFLYVGNAYPHKNLETLLRAYQGISAQAKLILVGKDDFFYQRTKKFVHSMNLDDQVIFFGQADDRQLTNLYAHATALVFPSLMEGFGLPALEAVVCGTPVICSDIPALHEILGHLGNYFQPTEFSRLRELIKEALRGNIIKPTQDEQKSLFEKFSWYDMASKTLHIYSLVKKI